LPVPAILQNLENISFLLKSPSADDCFDVCHIAISVMRVKNDLNAIMNQNPESPKQVIQDFRS